MASESETLTTQLRALELENQKLRAEIAAIKRTALPATPSIASPHAQPNNTTKPPQLGQEVRALSKDEYKRYGRQMIVPSIGFPGQLRLKNASVLIVGAGGLGCPAAAYLAGAGVGKLGICDGDDVETSNLHRQIAHATSRVGWSKTESMVAYLRDINPHVTYVSHTFQLTPSIAAATITQYDLILDCTDHPAVRYLISDTCVLLGKPLVSASALRSEGQLLVLNNPPGKGACYRCIWPKPPPPESVLSCGEGGILGPVVGTMGVLMATEAIKVLTTKIPSEEERSQSTESEAKAKKPTGTNMLLYSAYSDVPFRNLKLRGKKKGCIACDLEKSEISLDKLENGRLDYIAFCGSRIEDRVTEDEKINVQKLAELRGQGTEHVLIDVRPEIEWGICKLDGGINIPIHPFLQSLPLPPPKSDSPTSLPSSSSLKEEPPSWLPQNTKTPIFIVCKQGNDSQVAVRRLKNYLTSIRPHTERGEESEPWEGGIWDVKGGLVRWAREVDTSFPEY